MTMVIIGLVVVAVIVGVWLMRSSVTASPPPQATSEPATNLADDEIDGPTLAGPNARAPRLQPDALAAPTAPSADLGMVSCTTDGAVLGALVIVRLRPAR